MEAVTNRESAYATLYKQAFSKYSLCLIIKKTTNNRGDNSYCKRPFCLFVSRI